MKGVPANLSESDREKVDELRELVKEHLTPYYDTDFNLLRWLVGHNYDIELLKPKLINHLTMRKFEDWNLDGIASTPRNHVIHNFWKSGLSGEAGKTPNAIVNVEQTGMNDYWGLLATYSTTEVLKARVHDLESMLAAVMKMEARTGERGSILYIMDLSGLKMDRNVTTLVSGALASISAFMSDHYVELIHSFVLVNVPAFISAIWTLARPLLPERTRNKVKIFGSNWQKEILQLADASVLPSYWNAEGSDVFSANIERGVPVPKELYYAGSLPADVQTLSVKSGKTGTIDLDLKEGQSIHYLLHSDGQFAFAIYFTDDAEISMDPKGAIDKWQRVYPLFQKIPGPTTVPLKDTLKCPKTGKYRLWISNEHAWFHTLTITYQLRID